MRLGYNTNGLAHHDLLEAVALLAEIGYRSVAITIDHRALAPGDAETPRQLRRLRALLDRQGMTSVIETGARYLLDPRHKHEPTLLSPRPEERARRLAFYRHALACAAELQSQCVSLWSGRLPDPADEATAFARLLQGLQSLVRDAETVGIPLGFEPEPGMFIDTMAAFERLLAQFDAPLLRLTLDIGHLHCQGETPPEEYVRRYARRLVNVHIEDMRRGVHEHLMFGEGEIDFLPVICALAETGYAGGVHVELSRHSHEGPEAAQRAYDFLAPMFDKAAGHAPQ